MEHIIQKEAVGWMNISVWCSSKSEHYYLSVNLSKFDNFKKQIVDCRCSAEQFVIERKVILDVKKQENPA